MEPPCTRSSTCVCCGWESIEQLFFFGFMVDVGLLSKRSLEVRPRRDYGDSGYLLSLWWPPGKAM